MSEAAMEQFNLAVSHQAAGRLEEAIAHLRAAVRLQPNFIDAHNRLGQALYFAGRNDEAIAAYRTALHIRPDLGALWNNLGVALRDNGRLDEALAATMRAVTLLPQLSETHSTLASVLMYQGRTHEALAAAQKAVELNRDSSEAWFQFGNALQSLGRHVEAIDAYRKTIQFNPAGPAAWGNLATILYAIGRLDEAIAADHEALKLAPEFYDVHSGMLFALNGHPRISSEQLFQEHLNWGRRHAAHIKPMGPHTNDRNPDRRLRVSYVSADFAVHSVSYFLQPLLEAHDRAAVEIFGYSNVRVPDASTEALRKRCDHWRPIQALSDEKAAELVRQDQIDVLVDLSGHSAGGRLLIFARRPAPVQFAYLGYPNTTGLSAIGYRITDALADPVGSGEQLYTEHLVRLPRCAWCYRPPANSPEVNNLPAAQAGHVTFGSFSALAKINDDVIVLWRQVLDAVPRSRLVIKSVNLRDPEVRREVRDRFAAGGIEAARLDVLEPMADVNDHLAAYHRVDIALDTFPYHGTTTSCEALWMGVPVVTLAGDRHASRVGVSLLSTVGMEDLIARDAQQFVQIAADLARDRTRLQHLRATLRLRMQQSALMDARSLAHAIEDAYRAAWRSYGCVRNE
jgi:protein O-GlcNAc transferase